MWYSLQKTAKIMYVLMFYILQPFVLVKNDGKIKVIVDLWKSPLDLGLYINIKSKFLVQLSECPKVIL